MESTVTHIYTLSHPVTGEVRYVGKANDPDIRYKKHITQKGFSHKENWIKYLIGQSLLPALEIIDTVSVTDWAFWEMHYIKLFKSFGARLTNSSMGGDGNVGYKPSEETKEKLRLANIGKRHSDHTRSKMKENSGKYWLGKKRSEDTNKKVSKANTGKRPSLETRAKLSESHKGEKHHFFGKKLSEDHKAKLWANRDRIISDQARKNLADGVRKSWIKRKEAKCLAA